MLDWNDLKYFLAVARGGSTLAASRAMRVSQTTVARRIAALEEAVGLTLFEKRPAGYALTPPGEELLGHAEEVEAVKTGDGTSLRTFSFTPTTKGHWELVAYGREPKYVLFFCVSATSKQGLEKNRAAFLTMVASYTSKDEGGDESPPPSRR